MGKGVRPVACPRGFGAGVRGVRPKTVWFLMKRPQVCFTLPKLANHAPRFSAGRRDFGRDAQCARFRYQIRDRARKTIGRPGNVMQKCRIVRAAQDTKSSESHAYPDLNGLRPPPSLDQRSLSIMATVTNVAIDPTAPATTAERAMRASLSCARGKRRRAMTSMLHPPNYHRYTVVVPTTSNHICMFLRVPTQCKLLSEGKLVATSTSDRSARLIRLWRAAWTLVFGCRDLVLGAHQTPLPAVQHRFDAPLFCYVFPWLIGRATRKLCGVGRCQVQ